MADETAHESLEGEGTADSIEVGGSEPIAASLPDELDGAIDSISELPAGADDSAMATEAEDALAAEEALPESKIPPTEHVPLSAAAAQDAQAQAAEDSAGEASSGLETPAEAPDPVREEAQVAADDPAATEDSSTVTAGAPAADPGKPEAKTPSPREPKNLPAPVKPMTWSERLDDYLGTQCNYLKELEVLNRKVIDKKGPETFHREWTGQVNRAFSVAVRLRTRIRRQKSGTYAFGGRGLAPK